MTQPKARYYLSIKVGIESPFHAQIFEIGHGVKLETRLASLADVEGFLKDVRPIAWDEHGSMTVVPSPPEPLDVLIKRAIRALDRKQSSAGHAGLILADVGLETLRGHFEKWRKTPAS